MQQTEHSQEPTGMTRGKRRPRFWIGSAILTVAVCALVIGLPGEPTYSGHPMHYWAKRATYKKVWTLNYHDDGFRERRQAFSALVMIGEPAVPELIKLARNSDPMTRWDAVEALAAMGGPAVSAVPMLRQFVKVETFTAARNGAVGALWKIAQSHPVDQQVVADISSTMVELISDPTLNSIYAGMAANAVGPTALPALLKLLKSTNPTVRARAASALGYAHAEPDVSISALVGLLHDPEANVRASAAATLGQFHSDAKRTIPVLAEALYDSDTLVRLGAVGSIQRIDRYNPTTIKALVLQLDPDFGGKQEKAVRALGGIATACRPPAPKYCNGLPGPLVRNALPKLLQLMDDGDPSLRVRAAEVVWTITRQRELVMAAVKDLFDDPQAGARAKYVFNKVRTARVRLVPIAPLPKNNP